MPQKIIIPSHTELYANLMMRTSQCRILMFAGLPGVGKTLILQQAAIMAQMAGRNVYLLQWDVARMAFETPEILARYPEIDGATHMAIRKATGRWARQAVANWQHTHPNPKDLLLGELPIVGNRLVELVEPNNDAAEAVLNDAQTHFVIPVPSNTVRQAIEQARQNSITAPRHARESADAPPNVLQALWHDLHALAVALGFVAANNSPHPPAYDAPVYAKTFQYLLRHRKNEVLWVNEAFATQGSAYDLEGIVGELAASPSEVTAILQ